MAVLFSISACFTGFAVSTTTDDQIIGTFVVHMCVQMFYIIMAPIVGVRMYDEMEVNRENIIQLQNFSVINECADQYTNVNTDMIASELDEAFALSKWIEIWFWTTMGMLFFEVVSLCAFPLIACLCESRGSSDEVYIASEELSNLNDSSCDS